MEFFNYIIILLAAVLMSNLINNLLPTLSVPIVQIALGVFIGTFVSGWLGQNFLFNPELFFVLFLSPLVYQSTMTADKNALKSMISPILMAAVVLIVVTSFIAGIFTNLLIPAIPLAATFALAGALGPTDIVAVEAVAHRAHLPRRIVSFLSGESLISDATGIVCFLFAIKAAETGAFNAWEALGSFLVLAAGGITAGVALTVLKYMLVRWLRALHMNSSSLHISLGIMTPFIIYMVAEELGTSGILAVFASGLCHSLFRDKFNPEAVSLNNANDSVWDVLSFSLDGLVFVMLGIQLPQTLIDYSRAGYETHVGKLITYILLVFMTLITVRFLWWIIMVRKKVYNDPAHPIGKIKSGMIFTIAGARGAVSMAIVLSIPLFLPDGSAFPERDLIVLIAGGVIILSLLMTNFILPLLADEKNKKNTDEIKDKARVEILQSVVTRLKEAATPENFTATQIITRNYYSRMNYHPKTGRKMNGLRKFRHTILLWEKEVVLHMAELEHISKASAEHHIEEVDRLIAESGKRMNSFNLLWWTIQHIIESLTWREAKPRKKDLQSVKQLNKAIIRERMNELHIDESDPAYSLIAAEHEKVVSSRMGVEGETQAGLDTLHAMIIEVASYAFYIERILIQEKMEEGELPWKTAKEMQANIAMLEAQLKVE